MGSHPDNDLIGALFSVSRLLRKRFTQDKASSTSSMLQIKTLAIIDELSTPSMSEIAEHLHILLPSATDIVKRLVKAGSLQRAPDTSDRRIVRMSLTPDGKTLLKREVKKISKDLSDFFNVLTEKEKKDFQTILRKIIDRTSS